MRNAEELYGEEGVSFSPGNGGGDVGRNVLDNARRINVNMLPSGQNRNQAGTQIYYALTLLHEIIHTAGGYDRYGAPIYSDYKLAAAVKVLTGAPGYPDYTPRNREEQEKLLTETGNYWDRGLRRHCSPTEGGYE